jgi:hypothetical protein
MSRLRRAGRSAAILGMGLCLLFGCGTKLRLAPVPQTRTEPDKRQVRIFDFDGDGRPEYREVLGQTGQVVLHEFDVDGDGTFRDVVNRADLDPNKIRHLFLLLDGVPYSLIDQMWQDGYFRIFSRPGRMVSLFPSLTDPAFDQMFHCGLHFGYDGVFYAGAAGRKTDGVAFYLSGKNEAWAKGVDYRIPTLEDAVMYLYPGGVFRRELNAARKVYDRMQHEDTVVLYFLSTDGICHMFTRQKAREQFALLDRWIEQIVYDAHGRIEVTMWADHGNNFAGCCFVPITEALKEAGLHLADRLRRSGDVVAPHFGLINFASLFCYSDDERQRAVAAVLPLEGIDAIAWRADGGVKVINRQGTARIFRKGGEDQRLFCYQSVDGDPLGVVPAMKRMQDEGQLDAEGYASDQAWFVATRDLPMPAPVQRVYGSLCCDVINTADIVISMADGYFYGDKTFTDFVKLRGTHGGLSRESTDSFLMSSAFEAPAYVRPDEVLPLVNRYLAWTPHIPGIDYAWLEQYRKEIPSPSSRPARIEPAGATQPATTRPPPQAALP